MDKGVIWIEFLLVILYIIWDLILSLNECFQSNSRPSLPIQAAMLSRGGHVPPRANFFLQILYEDMNFIYKITDLTPPRLICPPWNCECWEHPWIQVQNKTKQVQSVNNKENMEFKEKKI